MTSLLDVNVLISLLDSNHQHHEVVTGWLNQNQESWATCPITQNGYLRIVTQEKYANTIDIHEAIRKLTQAIDTPLHEFLSDDISLLDQQLVAHRHIQGHKQLTDIYLLALSVSNEARFVTLDENVPTGTVPQATNASIHVIRP